MDYVFAIPKYRGHNRGGFRRGSAGSVERPFDSKFYFSWEILDKFDKFWTLFLTLLFNKSILLPVNVCKFDG